MLRPSVKAVALGCLALALASVGRAATVDLSGRDPKSKVEILQTPPGLAVVWPVSAKETGRITLNLADEQPLFTQVSIGLKGRRSEPIAAGLDPFTVLTVGDRDSDKAMRGWVFFDNPRSRPFTRHVAELTKRSVRVTDAGSRTTIHIGDVTAGSFKGELRINLFQDSPLIQVQTVLKTDEKLRAIVYDTGLVSAKPDWNTVAWREPHGRFQEAKVVDGFAARSLAVKHRTLVAQGAGGSLAVFPHPHQFFYPLDFADNFEFAWFGHGWFTNTTGYGLGIRQPLQGDSRWVPWFDAPEGTEQKLSVFYHLSSGDAAKAIDAVAAYTRADRFKELPGHKTFTSHYHVEHTVDYLDRQKKQGTDSVPKGLETPGFVTKFKETGVDIVHLAEFHHGWTPGQKTADRLPMLKRMHEECARLSDDELLLLPGEEPNVHLGGHWISFFPKPVYWVLNRPKDVPFVEDVEGYGKVYHVGSADDVFELMKRENGLMWTAHPRIKSSLGFPDAYRTTDFYQSDRFLGAAWKAMPADLSRPRLGYRVLDLLDDMNNWGQRKQALGEVDVFRIEPDYELYAHMNVNYLRLDQVPRYDEGWQPVLDAVRGGEFFVTTGEILVPKFTLGGKESGETLEVAANGNVRLEAELEWTFPLVFAEVVSGDGRKVYRERIDLADTGSFGQRTLKQTLNLKGRTWARFEVWDIAANGAFTQPVWLGAAAIAQAPEPTTGARFVPERRDDFAWENDLVAFRTYGPDLRSGAEDSGIDCWLKRTMQPVIEKWYAGDRMGRSYHVDHGEGYDPYHVGRSRGCGGLGIWKDGKLVLSDVYRSWKIVEQTREKSVFELGYVYDLDGAAIHETKRITIALGQQLFDVESTFTRDGQPVALDIGIGVTTHDGKAQATLRPQEGWMACWETIDGSGLGTGVVLDPKRVVEMREIKSATPDESHALVVVKTDTLGKVAYRAGFGWAKAGRITSEEQWHAHLAKAAKP